MVTLVPAAVHDREALENLMQLYAHDWSELRPLEVGDDGRFAPYPLDVWWTEPGHCPFLFRVQGKLAGFALVAARSRLTNTDGIFDMAEFFVLRRYRRQGVGSASAGALFERFKGTWEIRQRDENTDATAFWRRVIERHAGTYDEVRWAGPAWTGPVQTFSTLR